MNQYLINLSSKTIVGRFANIAEAEVAGEVLLAPEPYDIRDQETLLSYSRDELRALLAGLGLEVKANWPKAQFVEKVVNMAEAAEFAPINPPKSPEPAPAPKVKKEHAPREGKVGVKVALRRALEAGEVVDIKVWAAAGYGEVSFKTAISDLRSPKYCGQGLLPLTIIREGTVYRLA